MIQVKTITRRWIETLLGMLLLVGSTALQAAQEDPEVEAQFQAGLEALKNDDLKTAIQTFSKILDTDPDLHRARLELALAYYRSLRYEDAEKLAQRVLDDSTTPPEVRVTILAFLAQIKRDSEQFGRKHSFTPFVMGGIMHDSNINVGPTNANIRVGDIPLSLTQGSLKRSDNAYVVNAGVDHLYQSGKRVEFGERTGMLVWQSGLSVYK
ncbi:MAG TPA: tetratricopeptide repeat protein, partial [Gammaproteobacteria bacterium]|nr:tetratricopeptide repeat protein [Gammaproteobacteria bacterium]